MLWRGSFTLDARHRIFRLLLMPEFSPVNSLETKLRAIIRDKNTPSWSFYTPLAAAPLWVIIKNYPELDGSDLVAPGGRNPDLCVFQGTSYSYVGLYTAHCRVEQVFEQWKIPRADFISVSAPGYQLLRYVSTCKAEHIWVNAGLKDCQYHLDPDMVDILLSRPEPSYEVQAGPPVEFDPDDDPASLLGPLKEFLSRQPKVRAAWIMGERPPTPLPPGHRAYQIGLVMEDPEDNSLLHEVGIMAKALTPVEMEWTPTILMADDQSLRNLVKKKRPFFQSPGFLKKQAGAS
jgi:hypothetical protein